MTGTTGRYVFAEHIISWHIRRESEPSGKCTGYMELNMICNELHIAGYNQRTVIHVTFLIYHTA